MVVKFRESLRKNHMISLFGHKFRETETNLAEAISRFAGSMTFVYLHIIWFAFWIIFAKSIGDPFPYGLLTMIVSLEAIFLATFIMVNQNRQAELEEQRLMEEDEEQEEIAEDIEDIQEDFDTLQKDLAEVRTLISRIESRYSGTEVKKEEKPVAHTLKRKAR